MMLLKTLLSMSAFALPVAALAQTSTAAPETEAQPSAATTQDEPGVQAQQAPAAGAVVAATQADVKAGTVVTDQAGQNVGKVESVTSAGAVVTTGKSRAQIPLEAFGKKDGTLVIAMSKAELEAAVAAQKPPS